MPSPIVSRRHDILVLFDVTNGNPNGDPDAGNLPRIDPTTNKGLVSDVCLKRKVRNFVLNFPPSTSGTNQFDIFVRSGAILNPIINAAVAQNSAPLTALPPNPKPLDKHRAEDQVAQDAVRFLCRQFYDIRTFGAVLSTGDKGAVMTGSAHGQVRGPVQVTFGRSCDPITPLEVSIGRCAVTKIEDVTKERTMGNKHIVPYALYVAKAFVSPVFAERTGFTEDDLALFFEAVQHMFDHDQSAARAEMTVRGIYDFEHVGTQGENNATQNAREAKLGCAHAYKLFEGVAITLQAGKDYPESFADYTVTDNWTKDASPTGVKGVRLTRHVDPRTQTSEEASDV